MAFGNMMNWARKSPQEAAKPRAEINPAIERAFSVAVGDVKRNLEFMAPGVSEATKAKIVAAVDGLDVHACEERLASVQPHEALYQSDSTLKNVQSYVSVNTASAIDHLNVSPEERDALFDFVQTLD